MLKFKFILIKFLTCIFFLTSLSVQIFADISGDSIPPVFTTIPMDLTISCDAENPGDLFIDWFNSGANSVIEDEGNIIAAETTISFMQALEIIATSDVECDIQGVVEVGFFAIDDCQNSSDTLFASFSLLDSELPVLISPPNDNFVICNANTPMILDEWVQSIANAEVEDNCADPLVVTYTWEDNQGNSGAGELPNPTDIPIARDSCAWFVFVDFLVSDGCGNTIELEGRFDVLDNEPPGFSPEINDITLLCSDPLPGPGNLQAIDACDGVIDFVIEEVSTQDPDSTNCGHYNYELTRTYTAVDACGNIGEETQFIQVVDTIPPSIFLQDTLMLSCAEFEENDINTFVDFFGDACSDVLISFTVDEIETNDCDFAIQRNYLVRDRCSNVVRDTQIILVVNDQVPELVQPAQDLLIPCDTIVSFNFIFQQWLSAFGASQANSACVDLEVFAANPGTYTADDPSTYPGTLITEIDTDTCSGSGPGFANSVAVDFVYFDPCGNFLVTSAMAHIVDDIAPSFESTCSDTLVFTTTDSCFADINFLPPGLNDNCGELESPNILQQSQPIISSNPGDVSAVVDSICFTFANFDGGSILQNGEVNLTLNLNNVDADDIAEVFELQDENGIVLGITPNTSSQCGDTSLVVLDIPSGILNIWAIDEEVKFLLVPIGEGVNAVNDVCPGSTVDLTLSYEVELSDNVILSYAVEQEAFTDIALGDTITLGLDVGVHEITYQAIDCGGNMVSCTEFINIRDGSPPDITCPADITLPIQNLEGCQSAYFLDETIQLFDDCGLAADSLQYSVNGATTIPLTSVEIGDFIILEAGVNLINLRANDASGNSSICSFEILVRDTLDPVAICQDITLMPHPGLETISISIEDIDNGSEDTCGEIEFEISDTLISCEVLNNMNTIDLMVFDAEGNSDTCSSNIVLEPFPLSPVASLGFCAGDTLFLLANLPEELLGFEYTYNWTGPSFSSDQANPTIFNASNSNNGLYTLEITGSGGCTAIGTLDFDFDEAADQLEITSESTVFCTDESVTLVTDEIPGAVQYLWFEGIPPNGVPITTTIDANEITIFPADGLHSYYVQVDFGACLSTPSNVIEISLNQPPVAAIAEGSNTAICTGEDLILNVENPVADVEYQWIGSQGLITTGETLVIEDIDNTLDTEINLVPILGPCEGEATSISIEIIPGFDTPFITGEVVYCEGSTISLCAENVPEGELFNWFLNDGPNPFITTVSNKLEIPNASSFFSGEWTVVAQNFNCQSDASPSYEITVEDEIQIGASNNGPGCEGDSITLTATFLPGATYTWTSPDNVNFQGQMVTVPAIEGDYNLLVETAAGCENTTTTSVVVSPVGTITSVSNTANACMEIGDSVVFQASVFPPANYTYQWTGPNGFMSDQATAVLDSFTLESNGVYELIIINNNCESNVATTSISSNIVPARPQIERVAGFCDGDLLVLESSEVIEGIEYVWNTPSGTFTTDNGMLELSSMGNQIDGFYTLSLNSNGCFSDVSDTLFVSLDEMPNQGVISGNSEVCEGDQLTLMVDQAGELYIWSGAVDTITMVPSLVIDDIDTGGQVFVTIQNGLCASEISEVFTYDFIPLPEDPILDLSMLDDCVMPTSVVEICIDNFDSGLTYALLDGNGAGIGFVDTECFTIANDLLDNGQNMFGIFASQNACRSEEIEFSLNAVQANFTGAVIQDDDMTLCDNGEITLFATNVTDGAELVWTSDDPDLVFVQDGNQVFVSNLKDGNNTIILNTNLGSCTNISTDEINIAVLSAVNANDDIISIDANQSTIVDVVNNDDFGNEVSVTIIGPPTQGEAFVDEGRISYIPPSGFFGQVSIIYEICETMCPSFCSRATLTIEIGNLQDCFVPTVITPNGDDVNDALIIPCLNSSEFFNNELIIFNQWGDEVFSANPYRNDWQGTYLGDDLPVGTYYYILDLQDGNRPLNGFLIIER